MNKSRKKGSLSSLGEILPKTISIHGLEKEFHQWQVIALWDEAVGKTIAEAAQPIRFFRGTLTVVVKNSVWVQELQFMKQEMMDRLNRALAKLEKTTDEQIPLSPGMIKSVRFFVGKLPSDPMKPDRQKDTPIANAQSSENTEKMNSAQEETKTIHDPELRQILTRLFARAQNRKNS